MKTISELIKSEGNEKVKIVFHEGLPYVLYALRHPTILHWCGYIGFPEGSEYMGENSHSMIESLGMHMGDTFSGSFPISDDHHFVGFDCGHSIDFVPRDIKGGEDMKEIDAVNRGYRTLEWVWSELERMSDHIENFVYIPKGFNIDVIIKGDWDGIIENIDLQSMHEQFNVQVNILRAKVKLQLERDWK